MSLRKLLQSTLLALVALTVLASAGWALTAQPIPGEVIVKYRAGTTNARRDQVMSLLSNVQRRRDFSFIRAELVKSSGMSTEQMLTALRRDPSVEYAEPNYRITMDVVPNDPRFAELYGMRNTGQTGGTAGADIRATNAWDVFTGDPALKIGIIDTGVDYNHPDLTTHEWKNSGSRSSRTTSSMTTLKSSTHSRVHTSQSPCCRSTGTR